MQGKRDQGCSGEENGPASPGLECSADGRVRASGERITVDGQRGCQNRQSEGRPERAKEGSCGCGERSQYKRSSLAASTLSTSCCPGARKQFRRDSSA